MAIIKIHEDILGQPISLGSYMAVARSNTLDICSVIKITPKMLRVVPIKRSESNGYFVYPSETVILSGPDAMVYILKNS